MFKELTKLAKIINKNKIKNPNISYTATIYKKGKNFCIKKFMEEAKEFATASRYYNKKNIVHEAADLLYHFLVLLESKKINFNQVLKELSKRRHRSGFEEKKNRK